MKHIFTSLLSSPTPLDPTAKDSLKILLAIYDLPEDIEIGMKETMMLVMHQLIEKGEGASAMRYIKSPTDIMRYLWYEKTGASYLSHVRQELVLRGKDESKLEAKVWQKDL